MLLFIPTRNTNPIIDEHLEAYWWRHMFRLLHVEIFLHFIFGHLVQLDRR